MKVFYVVQLKQQGIVHISRNDDYLIPDQLVVPVFMVTVEIYLYFFCFSNRKKHGVLDREEIERSVYLNQFALDEMASLDNFHSPDTICKYCGVDFKFFRALKNHLRSHNSCRQKPFQCQLCEMSFCTKMNCLRHIQKLHPEINNNQIENHIRVIEHSANEDTDNESVNSDDGIPLYTDDSKMLFDCRSENSTPQPPAAHSTPKPESLLGNESRHVSPSHHFSPSRHLSPLSHTSPSPSPLLIKTEPVERVDTPLDFSMKSNNFDSIKMETSPNQPVTLAKTVSDETPIDLTVKKQGIPVPIAPKVNELNLNKKLKPYSRNSCTYI